jgi:hypothetical protein
MTVGSMGRDQQASVRAASLALVTLAKARVQATAEASERLP